MQSIKSTVLHFYKVKELTTEQQEVFLALYVAFSGRTLTSVSKQMKLSKKALSDALRRVFKKRMDDYRTIEGMISPSCLPS